MRLLVVRHGQTAWNTESRAQGHTDVPLDEKGERQAQCLARSLAGLEYAEVWTSDLKRASRTGEILSKTLSARLRIDSRLRERSFGHYEGMVFKELHAQLSQQQELEGVDALCVRPPSGESLRDAFDRLQPIAKELFRCKENRIVVGHGASCALLMAHLIKGTVESSRSFRFGNTAVTEFIRRPEGQFQMLRYNDTSHLGALNDDPIGSGSVDGVVQ
jgi:broad specificity phosphatase PhoE